MIWAQEDDASVVTAVRVRPMSDDERKAGCRSIITMVGNQTTVVDPAGLSPTASAASSFRRRQSAQLNPTGSPSKFAISSDPSPIKRPSLSAEAKAKVWSQTFTYDHSFWSCDPDHANHADQQYVFDRIGSHMLATAWKRVHVSLFAYGQTGAGKSFSMMGKSRSNHHEARGLVPRICQALFETMQRQSNEANPDETRDPSMTTFGAMEAPPNVTPVSVTAPLPFPPQCTVKMTFVEIYNERVFDLLQRNSQGPLKVREHPEKGTYVEHVSNLVVTSAHDVEYLLSEGNKTRTVAATHMNQLSSRSHAILTLTLHWLDKKSPPTKLCMVDLAGSERTDLASGDRLREATAINKSLSALGDVINALATSNQAAASKCSPAMTALGCPPPSSSVNGFVQYRNSVLTRLLKDSLSGSARLYMLAAISPCCIHYDETLSTLKYVERSKLALVTPPTAPLPTPASVDTPDAVAQLRLELCMLRSQLRIAQQHTDLGSHAPDDMNTHHDALDASTTPQLDDHADWIPHMNCSTLSLPHLVNLNQDPRYTERVVYCIEEGITTVGAGDDDLVPDVVLAGADMLPLHTILHCANGVVRIRPAAAAQVLVNGYTIEDTTELVHGARVILGSHHVFRYDAVHTNDCATNVDWHVAHNELLDKLVAAKSSHPPSDVLPTRPPTTSGNREPAPRLEKATQCDPLAVDDASPPCQDVATQVDAAASHQERTREPCITMADATTQTHTPTTSAGTQHRCDSSIQFDETEKLVLERKLAKLKLLLKKKDKQLQNGIAKATPPQPMLSPPAPSVDPAINDRLIQLHQLFTSILGGQSPALQRPAALADNVRLLEIQAQAIHDLWHDTPASSKPLAWLLQELSAECKQQIALWSQAQTLQLSSAAKTIANLEGRFASLCFALNDQCAHEKTQFQASFDLQHDRHEKLVAAQASQLDAASVAHRESMTLLENAMASKMEAAIQAHQQSRQNWMDEIEATCHRHVQELTAMSVQAALDEDKLRLKMAEWETKCASLVAEADMVLCETRAMHAKELRNQQDAVALKLYDMEMVRMAQEERFLRDTEAFVRATDATLRDRELEQVAWTDQKQLDLQALHAEHEDKVRQIVAEHDVHREKIRQAIETIQIAHEDRYAKCVLSFAILQHSMHVAEDENQSAIAAHGRRRDAAEADHTHAMASRDDAWRAFLANFDAKATNESVQHARFMKQLVQRHTAEVQAIREDTAELEAAIAQQDAEVVDRVAEWERNLDALQADHDARLARMHECHDKILRDLNVAFESQQAKRREECASIVARYHVQEEELKAAEQQRVNAQAMEIEDVRSRHSATLAALAAVQITMRSHSTAAYVVDSYRDRYDTKQRTLDAEAAALRAKCSDVERVEIEKHNHANQAHVMRMAELLERHQECLERVHASTEDSLGSMAKHVIDMTNDHQAQVDAWHRAHELRRQQLDEEQLQRQRDHDAEVVRMQALLDDVEFAHKTTCADISAHHATILQDHRLLHAQDEERWMQAYEDCQRRQAWALSQVQVQCASEIERGEASMARLHAVQADAVARSEDALAHALRNHERWCMDLEDARVREHGQCERMFEAQWQVMQLDMDEREARLHRRIQELKREADESARDQDVALHAAQERWMEALSSLYMQKEDRLSTHLAQMTAMHDAHARDLFSIRLQISQHEERIASQKELAELTHESARVVALRLNENQQAFYDEAAAAIDVKLKEMEARHTAQLEMQRDNHSRMFQLLEEAQVAQRKQLHSDKLQLEQELRAQLTAWRDHLDVEKQAALRVLSIQDEAWQEEVTIELDGKYRDACAALATDSAAQEAAFQLKLHCVQEFWRMELANIQLGLEDTLSHHMRAVDAAQHEFDRDMLDIAQKEHEIETRTQMQHAEAAERRAMAAAEKEAMEVRLRALRYDMVQHERERHDEFHRVWRDMFCQILAVQNEKARVRHQCVREIQALERIQIRDVRAQVPCGDRQPVPDADPSVRRLLRMRIQQQLTISERILHDVEYDTNMDLLREVCRAQQCNAEMAVEDDQSRMSDRRQRAIAFLDQLPSTQVHPMPPRATSPPIVGIDETPSFLLPIKLDFSRFPHLVVRPRAVHPRDEAIASQLKRNGDLVQRLEAERRHFKAKSDEASRAMAKMEASMASLEEMMRIADEKSKDDAVVIQLLQEKAKSCVVELPTRDVGPVVVVAKEAPDSSTRKTSLLRGWK
ncbi:hypothetical protein H310_11363 [Aphanomyces invadans]|uniref:Kinesin motor domain-containing protein n=1 Tax=Aphanomyces invadans TaxID=157072 RepID=A0A024TM48_9STRA|nr:hypothetical protein H310_11363 [Aphanomyces invadans]ETV95069.1 hypothetical protein H310_11363 [Aphanomyces invadans]|eukprot:XP_008876242.1 hypothetical protein H310_11363 [Aphanomyces invadans]